MWQNPDFLGQIENFKREEQVFEMFEGKMYIVEKKQKLWRLFIAHNLHYLDILLFNIRSRHYVLIDENHFQIYQFCRFSASH